MEMQLVLVIHSLSPALAEEAIRLLNCNYMPLLYITNEFTANISYVFDLWIILLAGFGTKTRRKSITPILVVEVESQQIFIHLLLLPVITMPITSVKQQTKSQFSH